MERYALHWILNYLPGFDILAQACIERQSRALFLVIGLGILTAAGIGRPLLESQQAGAVIRYPLTGKLRIIEQSYRKSSAIGALEKGLDHLAVRLGRRIRFAITVGIDLDLLGRHAKRKI